MSLLTPSESHAFQSFLSSIDYDYSIVDHVVASAEWSSLSDDIPVPHAGPGKEALAKATKDLMSLQPPSAAGVASAWSMAEIELPLFKQPHARTTRTSTTPAPVPISPFQSDIASSYQLWTRTRGRPPRPNSPLRRPTHLPVLNSHPPQTSRRDSTPSSSSSAPTLPPLTTRSSQRLPSKRSFSEDSSTSNASHKRARASPPSRSTPQPSSSTGSATPSQSAPAGKPALLTASQKKANHIQSEQKRRANIRRGYEALCETIPALREAIRAEDEANNASGVSTSASNSGKKRKTRGKVGDDGEKIDGRAGPRSENIVLAKTVDYLHELLSERQHLMVRLQHARSSLPRSHPALQPSTSGQPLWEREWTGGEGANDDDGGDGSDDDDS